MVIPPLGLSLLRYFFHLWRQNIMTSDFQIFNVACNLEDNFGEMRLVIFNVAFNLSKSSGRLWVSELTLWYGWGQCGTERFRRQLSHARSQAGTLPFHQLVWPEAGQLGHDNSVLFQEGYVSGLGTCVIIFKNLKPHAGMLRPTKLINFDSRLGPLATTGSDTTLLIADSMLWSSSKIGLFPTASSFRFIFKCPSLFNAF